MCRRLTLRSIVLLPDTVDGGSVKVTVAVVAFEDVTVPMRGDLLHPYIWQSVRSQLMGIFTTIHI